MCAAVPAMVILCLLLGSADKVFQNMLDVVLRENTGSYLPFSLYCFQTRGMGPG